MVSHLQRQLRLDPAIHIDLGKLLPLELRLIRQFFSLPGEICLLGIGLGTDRDIFAGGHRHGARHKARDTRNQDVGCGGIGGCDPIIKLAVETMPSFAPSTAARSQPTRETR